MPLTMNIEDARFADKTFVDARFARELNILDLRSEFIREMARVILANNNGYESVWTVANRVYDRHCSPQADRLNHSRFDRTALSA